MTNTDQDWLPIHDAALMFKGDHGTNVGAIKEYIKNLPEDKDNILYREVTSTFGKAEIKEKEISPKLILQLVTEDILPPKDYINKKGEEGKENKNKGGNNIGTKGYYKDRINKGLASRVRFEQENQKDKSR